MSGSAESSSPASAADEPGFDDIDAAYRRALEAAEAVEALVGGEIAESPPPPASPDADHSPLLRENSELSRSHEGRNPERGSRAPVSAAEVLEALLFVGGDPLSGKRLGELLSATGETSGTPFEELIDQLSRRYSEQGCPYEVRLVEGGYVMTLRPEYEAVRNRVHGQGPRDVKLSQDVLEILAFVAYQQPVTLADVTATGKKNAAGLLRQLLRRELVQLKRGEHPGDETYVTTPRFLQLFSLRELADLPQAVDFDFK